MKIGYKKKKQIKFNKTKKKIKNARSVLKYVDIIEFDFSSQCTRKCVFCDPGIPRRRRQNKILLDYKLHKNILLEIFLLEPNFNGVLSYCGHGEPTLHPQLNFFLQDARKILPFSKVVLFTNGDKFNRNICDYIDKFVDIVVFDNYDDNVGKSVSNYMVKYNLSNKIRCRDHVGKKRKYNSRAGCVFNPYKKRYDNCFCPQRKLFLAAEGYWLLCCQDYQHKIVFENMGLIDFLTCSKRKNILSDLLKTRKKNILCSRCEIRISPKRGNRRSYGVNPPSLKKIKRLNMK